MKRLLCKAEQSVRSMPESDLRPQKNRQLNKYIPHDVIRPVHLFHFARSPHSSALALSKSLLISDWLTKSPTLSFKEGPEAGSMHTHAWSATTTTSIVRLEFFG